MNALGDWIYWLAILGVVAVFAILIYVAWWALFADRKHRGRRRCPRCWYNLAYSPGMTCGECGFTGWHEKQFHRVRRRYKVAGLAIIACVVIAVLINERVTQTGWASSFPTRVLVMMMPLATDANSSISRELTSRAAMGKLSGSDWAAMMSRCAAGDFAARPTSAPWRAKYGNLIWFWRQSLSSDGTVNGILNAIPPRIDVTARDSWPAGVPVVVQVDVQDWWEWGMECRVRATPRIGGSGSEAQPGPITFYRTGNDQLPRRGFPLTLSAMDESTTEIAIDFEIARRPMLPTSTSASVAGDESSIAAIDDRPWEAAGTRTINVKMRIEPVEKASLAATTDEQMTALLKQGFDGSVVKWPAGHSPVRVRMNQPVTFQTPFDDVALGIHVDLLCDGQVARRLDLWWLGGTTVTDRHYGFEVASEKLELLRVANDADHRWQMRITGDQALALRAAGGKKFWQGEFTVPLKVQPMNGEAPGRAWWKEE